MAVQIRAACPRCQRGWLSVYVPAVPYHERPPFEDEQEDGIGARPCSGSFGRWARPGESRRDYALIAPAPATRPE